jgi:hypothetical protein
MKYMAKKFDVKSLRQKVLSTDDVVYDSFYVEEWDTELPIRTLSAQDLKKIMKFKEDEVRMAILAVLYGCKTKEGESVFEETDLAQFENGKAFGPVAKLGAKIMSISGLSNNEVKEAKND